MRGHDDVAQFSSPMAKPQQGKPRSYIKANKKFRLDSKPKTTMGEKTAKRIKGVGKRFMWCFGPGEGPEYGTPGFSRLVFVNNPGRHKEVGPKYRKNNISTTKYNPFTFIPKSLYEQFRKVANLYFLLIAALSLTPISPLTTPLSQILPLILVVGLDILRETIEDWRRFQADREVNSRKVLVHSKDGVFVEKTWQDIQVGDIVCVKKDEFFPADLLFLSSSYEDGVCYVETMNLDGETNLKLMKALEITLGVGGDGERGNQALALMKAEIKCEDPNSSLYTFIGNLEWNGARTAIAPQQILLRDSKLRNTAYIYGAVIFTGFETKVMQNSTDPPSKRSRIERQMDKIIYLLFTLLLVLSSVSGIVFGVLLSGAHKQWYLIPESTDVYFDPNDPLLSGFLQGISALMLYAYLIPISLYVSIAFVKVIQASLMNLDLKMYYAPTDRPARARTSNLNEELGQVETILSDKTGTLTCNQMDFMKCCVAGVAYGRGVTEVEMAAARRLNRELPAVVPPPIPPGADNSASNGEATGLVPVKGFSLQDERILNGAWMKQPDREEIRHFLRMMAVCHTVVPEVDDVTGAIKYEAESPDEAAFVVSARELGFAFFKRTQTSVFVHEPSDDGASVVEREYKVKNLLEFNSTRKRMSVVVEFPEGHLELMSKGADSVIYRLLSTEGKVHADVTEAQLAKYGEAGLRTLAWAYRRMDVSEYNRWSNVFQEARTTVGTEREAKLDAASELIEKDLRLLGATAVEDKLQDGVPETIERLAQAGINIWVLTGDKVETAINIGYAASLLRNSMMQIVISLEGDREIKAAEEAVDKAKIEELSGSSITRQLSQGLVKIQEEKDPEAVFALVIDGKALSYALETPELREQFLALATSCSSVICCRVSPRQKAQVTTLVKKGTGHVTLGVGDGANDVGMIQAADIGVGISGVEGMQAVMASDFAIGQFKFLQELLLKHGHWNYKRIAFMISYFFYKNLAFGLTVFYYNSFQQFSGARIYDDWYLSLYNVIFTSMPVIAVGMFDQDVSAKSCIKYPILYRQGIRNLFFSWGRIFLWMLNGVYISVVLSVLVFGSFYITAFRPDGRVAEVPGVGFTLYSTLVISVNLQMAASVNYWTVLQHVAIWGSIVLYYVFALVYGVLPYNISTNGHEVLTQVAGPSLLSWLVTLLGPVLALLPYTILYSLQRRLYPYDHQTIQEIQKEERKERRRMKRHAYPDELRKEANENLHVQSGRERVDKNLTSARSNLGRTGHVPTYSGVTYEPEAHVG